MAPRKKAANPDLPHSEDCGAPRIESFDVLDPAGAPVHVDRCQECGAQITS